MDFENYTLGRLFDDRGHYDMNHAGHQSAVAHVRGTVWALGWRKSLFEAIDREISQRQFHIHFHAQNPQAHEVIHNLAQLWTIIEETKLQHHLFGIKADTFIRAGVIVVSANRILMRPRKRELEIMPRHALMHDEWPWILGDRKRKVIEIGFAITSSVYEYIFRHSERAYASRQGEESLFACTAGTRERFLVARTSLGIAKFSGQSLATAVD